MVTLNKKHHLTLIAIAVGLAACAPSPQGSSTDNQDTQTAKSEPTTTAEVASVEDQSSTTSPKAFVATADMSSSAVYATGDSHEKVENLMWSSPQSSTELQRVAVDYDMSEPYVNTPQNTENYAKTSENPVKQVAVEPVSTFSIDVDTGSYTNTRRFINQGQLPPTDAVREEAFINYFDYNYPTPSNLNIPFNVHTELAVAPWNEHRQLVKIGIKGYDIAKDDLKNANLVFLLDVSGSMASPDKLPLLISSLSMLTKQLDENDSVAIVVYAGAAGVALPATKGSEKQTIIDALEKLSAGGSTNGGEGIQLAYKIAQENFKKNGVNRVILASDGDVNVGLDFEAMKKLIEEKRDTGIALTTLGFGQGNYNDALMEQLANLGNGQHAYIDNINEARKVLVDELSSSMQIIAKDVKIQIEFNPNLVAEYRLIGYENRVLANEDFNNDKIDAGELGAGHTVTAIYEITPADSEHKQLDDLRYQNQNAEKDASQTSEFSNELAFVKLRYKQPDGDTSRLISTPIVATDVPQISQASDDFQFATAVTGFAQLLKESKYIGDWSFDDSAKLAQDSKGDDPFGYRSEFIQLVKTTAAFSM